MRKPYASILLSKPSWSPACVSTKCANVSLYTTHDRRTIAADDAFGV